MANGWRHLAIILSLALSPNGYAQISNIEVTNDQSYIYFKFQENLAFTYYHIYIDSDDNSNTGFSLKGIGADRLLENGSAWKSTGKNWGWTNIATIPFANVSGNLSWKLPLSILGAPLQCNVPLKIIFSGEGGDNNDEFSSVINYSLNVGTNCGGAQITNVAASATDSTFMFSYEVSSPQALYRVYLDTDGKTSTGYRVGGIGANYLLIGKSLYSYTNGAWEWLKSIPFSQTGNTASWTVSRHDLGNRDCAGSLVYLPGVQKNGGDESLGARATLTY